MTTSTPVQSAPFARRVADAVSSMAGGPLVAHLTELHEAELRNQRDNTHEAVTAALQATAASMTQYNVLQSALEMHQLAVRRQGEHAARASHLGSLLGEIGRLVETAEGDLVHTEALVNVLKTRMPPPPWRPTLLAWAPSMQWRVGHFRSQDDSAYRGFPFAGWGAYEDAPTQVPGQTSVFLVDGNVKARPDIEREFGLYLASLE